MCAEPPAKGRDRAKPTVLPQHLLSMSPSII